MAKAKKLTVDRRGFLKGAAAGAAGTVVTGAVTAVVTNVVTGNEAQAQEQVAQRNATAQPNPATLAADTGIRPIVSSRIVEKPGSDFMVDVLKTLDLEYVAANPGSTFEGLHESLINYGDNKMPELLTCCHEESAVAMAHGYAKIEGKPMMALIHGTIGLQHASMAIYNAYADRVPIYMVVGDHADGAERASGVQSLHSAQDMGGLVRDYVKWDDQPYSLGHFAESAVRAYNIARTPPMAPVLITMNAELQLHPNTQQGLRIPRLSRTAPPQGDSAAVAQAAQWLVAAERPMIMTERTARTPNGMKLMIELAETLQSPVSSSERMDFPNRHPLAGTGGAGYEPDVIINLEVNDVSNTARAARARNAKTISISSIDLSHKANIQEFGHYSEVDLDIGADGEATLPALIEQCKKLITPDRGGPPADPGTKHRTGVGRLGCQPRQSEPALR
jgi:acetolactate synthase-1/2/3 large subunit